MASGSRAGAVGFTVGNCSSSLDLVDTSVYLSICPSEGSSDFLFLLCSRPVQDIRCLYLQYIKMPIPINIATASDIKNRTPNLECLFQVPLVLTYVIVQSRSS